MNEADEVLTLVFPSAIPVGKAELRIQYTGILNDQMRGFYLSKYTDAKGLEQRIATTQFEATDCRRAMPCWSDKQLRRHRRRANSAAVTADASADAPHSSTLIPPV